jgi:hypothetical protein
LASKRSKKKPAKKPLSKRALRALFLKRSEANKRGWQTRRAKQAPEKIAKVHKAQRAKVRAIEKKEAAAALPVNSRIYDDQERRADKARIEELEREKAALVKQITDRIDTSHFRDILPPEYLNEDSFTVAVSRCRLRHTAESEEIQEVFQQAYEDGGEQRVFNIAHKLLKQFQEDHEDYNWDWWTDDDPLTFQELISLYFSP